MIMLIFLTLWFLHPVITTVINYLNFLFDLLFFDYIVPLVMFLHQAFELWVVFQHLLVELDDVIHLLLVNFGPVFRHYLFLFEIFHLIFVLFQILISFLYFRFQQHNFVLVPFCDYLFWFHLTLFIIVIFILDLIIDLNWFLILLVIWAFYFTFFYNCILELHNFDKLQFVILI